MRPIQTSYGLNIEKAFEGMGYDISSGEHYGRSVEANPVRFGSVVVQGTGDNQCQVPTATGGFVIGVAEFEHVREQQKVPLVAPFGDGSTLDYVPVECEVSVRTQGRIWVRPENDVSPGDLVFFRHTAAGVQLHGAVRGADNDGGTCDAYPGARFMTTATAGGLAVVDLNYAS